MAARVPRPDYAHVGVHTYRIVWLTEDEWVQGNHPQDSIGATYAGRQLICMRLQVDAGESLYQEVLLHELTHAVWDSTGLTHVDLTEQKDREEFVINAQSPILLFVMKLNPDIVKYLMSDGTVIR